MLLIGKSMKLLTKSFTLRQTPLLVVTGQTSLKLASYFSTKAYRMSDSVLSRNFNPLVPKRPVAANCISSSAFVRSGNYNAASSDSKKAKQVSLHDIGEGISEVVIKEWKVKVGDSVKQSDGICEVESDKAAVIIQSPFDGIVSKLHYEVDGVAKVGLPLIDIKIATSSQKVAGQVPEAVENYDSTSVDEQRPPFVSRKEPMIPADSSSLHENTSSSSSPMVIGHCDSSLTGDGQIVATLPSVRRLAREKNVDLSKVRPTGKKGRILKEDLLAYLESKPLATSGAEVDEAEGLFGSQAAVATGVHHQKQQQFDRLIPLRGVQKAMFKTMTQSLKIPHFGYSDEIDMTRLVEAARRRQMNSFPKEVTAPSSSEGTEKVNNLAFIIKMVSLALLEYPQLNASIDENGEFLVEKHYHNIGVAVDTQSGLLVPNIKNVQNLTILKINMELQRLRSLGYASKLGINDLTGGTFTLSNIGAIGGIFGIPVLMTPEIVIGALGRIRKLPRFNSAGEIEEQNVMQIVWSADHRAVDGATLSRFSNLLKHYLEEPESALLKLT